MALGCWVYSLLKPQELWNHEKLIIEVQEFYKADLVGEIMGQIY